MATLACGTYTFTIERDPCFDPCGMVARVFVNGRPLRDMAQACPDIETADGFEPEPFFIPFRKYFDSDANLSHIRKFCIAFANSAAFRTAVLSDFFQ